MSALPLPELAIVHYTDDCPARVWDECGEQLVKAINLAGGMNADELRSVLAEGRMTLFLAVELGRHASEDRFLAALLAQIEQWNNDRVLCVLAAGGSDFGLWAKDMQAELLSYAQDKGCTRLRALCRPGMAKWLRKLGWSRVLETMELRDGPV